MRGKIQNVIERAIELAERRVRLLIEVEAIDAELDDLRAQAAPRKARAAKTRTKPRPKAATKQKRTKEVRRPDPPTKAGRPFGKNAAIGFLRETLKKGPMLTSEVNDLANKQGFTLSTIMRARMELRVVSEKTGKGLQTRLSLP